VQLNTEAGRALLQFPLNKKTLNISFEKMRVNEDFFS